MNDLRVIITIASFVVAVLGFALARAEKSNKASKELKTKIHDVEIKLMEFKLETAKEYATKQELAALKEFITGRFDRLENKLEGK